MANCGDSPAYIFREDKQNPKSKHKFICDMLSLDHKPDLPEESERILKSNGVLYQFESAVTGNKIGPMRVWSKEVR